MSLDSVLFITADQLSNQPFSATDASKVANKYSNKLVHPDEKWNLNVNEHLADIYCNIRTKSLVGEKSLEWTIQPFNSSSIYHEIISNLEQNGYRVETIHTSHTRCFYAIKIMW